jgi:hypothetical protein
MITELRQLIAARPGTAICDIANDGLPTPANFLCQQVITMEIPAEMLEDIFHPAEENGLWDGYLVRDPQNRAAYKIAGTQHLTTLGYYDGPRAFIFTIYH